MARTTMREQAAHDNMPPPYAGGALAQTTLPDFMLHWERMYRDEHTHDEAEQVLESRVSASRRMSVLVVDDERSIAELLADLLEGAGYDVFVATNGRTALAIARREHPALVLTDLMMPGVDGAEFVHRLRASPITNDIPVVMMSSIRPNMEAMENVPFLPKPFDLDDVLDAVQTYAGGWVRQDKWARH